MNFKVFENPAVKGNKLGIRSHLLILPSVVCSTHVSRKVANQVGAITFAHQHGCGIIGNDVGGIRDFFISLADQPNVGPVLIIGLGCETIQGNELAESIKAVNSATEYLVIQESGGMAETLAKGISVANRLKQNLYVKTNQSDSLLIGIDSEENNEKTELISEWLADFQIVRSQNLKNSGLRFSKLMEEKVQLIISLTEPNQPASGFPTIPTINIASDSALHQATISDFDLSFGKNSSLKTVSKETLLELISNIANGQLTKSEQTQSGEIIAPRMVRSV